MPYLALARSERPQTFEEVVGQEPVTTTLKNAINQNRVSHAYLFTGPRGVGKTSTARILAKALNCLSSSQPTAAPCNQCSNCLAITNGNSLDVIEIDGASNRGIEEIRSLRENVKFSPASSRYKIYIIDEVHMLTEQAFNALLKTLEEPPEHIVFMFATTEARKIPATILSRTQRFDLKEITTADIFNHLKKLTTKENIPSEDNGLRLIALKAQGSLRDSLSLLDQAIAYGNGQITAFAIGHLLGFLDSESYYQLAEFFIKQNTTAALTLLYQLLAGGFAPLDVTNGLSLYFRHLLLIKVKAQSLVALEYPENMLVKMQLQAETVSTARLLQFLQIFLPLEASIKKSITPEILLELAVIKITEFGEEIPFPKLWEKLNNLEQQLTKVGHLSSSSKSPISALPSTLKGEGTKFSGEEEENADALPLPSRVEVKWWPLFLERLAADNQHAMQNHLQNHVVKVEQIEEKVLLKIDNLTSFNSLNKPVSRNYLSQKIQEVLGENYLISCELVKPSLPENIPSASQNSALTASLPETEDPTLQMVIEKFKGSLVKFKPETKITKEELADDKYE